MECNISDKPFAFDIERQIDYHGRNSMHLGNMLNYITPIHGHPSRDTVSLAIREHNLQSYDRDLVDVWAIVERIQKALSIRNDDEFNETIASIRVDDVASRLYHDNERKRLINERDSEGDVYTITYTSKWNPRGTSPTVDEVNTQIDIIIDAFHRSGTILIDRISTPNNTPLYVIGVDGITTVVNIHEPYGFIAPYNGMWLLTDIYVLGKENRSRVLKVLKSTTEVSRLMFKEKAYGWMNPVEYSEHSTMLKHYIRGVLLQYKDSY